MAELDGKYLLVSDSNETSGEYDSRRLSYSDFVEIAKDALFKKCIGSIGEYVTENQFNMEKARIGSALDETETKLRDSGEWSRRFKAVEGQVIFIDVDEFDSFNRSLPITSRMQPIEYARRMWEFPQELHLQQIQDCMVRGVVEVTSSTTVKPSNQTISLTDENMPPHMHHSGITRNAKIPSMEAVRDTSSNLALVDGGIVYDMFKNESLATGIDKNELDGTVDGFDVIQNGQQEIRHGNIPPFRRCYAFIVQKA